MGRVVSEGRLHVGADRRGRVRPGRSHTISSIHSSAALRKLGTDHDDDDSDDDDDDRRPPPARVICAYCERGQKRRSWGTEMEASLEMGAPMARLFEELSQESELIVSLHARFEYLVGSVSDVGDLLIELFSPQLKEETETEQLRLVMAESDEGGASNLKRKVAIITKNSNSNSGVHTDSNKSTDGPAAAAGKAGKAKGAEWEGLGLGKIFGWNDKNADSSGKAKGEDVTTNKKPKVIALLPSCYCPIKKGTVYYYYYYYLLFIIHYLLFIILFSIFYAFIYYLF